MNTPSHTVRPAITVDGQRQTIVRPPPRLNADGNMIRAALLAAKGWPDLALPNGQSRDAA